MENNLNLKVVHTSPFPGKSFEYAVDNLVHAWLVLNTLASYDEFHLSNNIRTDFSSTQVLLVWDDGEEEWIDYNPSEYLDTEVEDISDLTLDELRALL